MPKEPLDQPEYLTELDQWIEIMNSNAWSAFKDFMKQHKSLCGKQLRQAVKNQDIIKANREEARMADADLIIKRISRRLKELKTKAKTKEK